MEYGQNYLRKWPQGPPDVCYMNQITIEMFQNDPYLDSEVNLYNSAP
jgi:hypothetical protein